MTCPFTDRTVCRECDLNSSGGCTFNVIAGALMGIDKSLKELVEHLKVGQATYKERRSSSDKDTTLVFIPGENHSIRVISETKGKWMVQGLTRNQRDEIETLYIEYLKSKDEGPFEIEKVVEEIFDAEWENYCDASCGADGASAISQAVPAEPTRPVIRRI